MNDELEHETEAKAKVTSDVTINSKAAPVKRDVSFPTVNTVNTVTLDPTMTKPKVSLTVFLNISGLKPEAYAGFLWWAKSRRLRTETIEGWWKLYDQHQNRPVR